MRLFAELNAFSCLFYHRNAESSLVKSLNGRTVSDKLWQNLLKYWHMPRKPATLAGSSSTPLSVSLCPMKVTEGDLNCNFLTQSRKSWLLHFSNRLMRFFVVVDVTFLSQISAFKNADAVGVSRLRIHGNTIDTPLVLKRSQMACECNSSDRLVPGT